VPTDHWPGHRIKLFTRKLIPSMSRKDMHRVYRLLKEAREQGEIPWEWIVDETRAVEKVATWANADEFGKQLARSYRRDFWRHQPINVELWSEKGTVRGVCRPVLDDFGVGFQPVHGFNGATCVHDACCNSDDSKPLIILYVGDFDPSGMCMSEVDLPKRFAGYGGNHVRLIRIALVGEQMMNLPSFPASDKRADTRYKWFVGRYGDTCWELDAMDQNDLRATLKKEIEGLIDKEAWDHCMRINVAEQESIKNGVAAWSVGRVAGEMTDAAQDEMQAVVPETNGAVCPVCNGAGEIMRVWRDPSTGEEGSETTPCGGPSGFWCPARSLVADAQ
jgi:hypothetical protein